MKSFKSQTLGLVKLPPEVQKYAKEIIKEYIVHHLDVLNICMKLEDEFSILVLLQFISSLGMLCFILYQMYDVSDFFLKRSDLYLVPDSPNLVVLNL